MIPNPPSPEERALLKLEKELEKAYQERDYYKYMAKVFIAVSMLLLAIITGMVL